MSFSILEPHLLLSYSAILVLHEVSISRDKSRVSVSVVLVGLSHSNTNVPFVLLQ